MDYFAQAAAMAPAWEQPLANLDRVRRSIDPHRAEASSPRDTGSRYLLIKAWGFGFWSDVNHVVGQLLLAELTGRTPVVHWGSNSLFWDGTTANAFEAYFAPVSAATAADLRDERLSIWPPKWNRANLLEGEVHKSAGPFSRMAGLYLLGRDEDLVVSDFFSSIYDLKPWIPRDSELHGLTIDGLHRHLVRKYLRPTPEVLAAVAAFHESRIGSDDYIAVHARGSDKILELRELDVLNAQYRLAIEEFRAQLGTHRIFLMTDDERLRRAYVTQYGSAVISTDCQRTDTADGVHYQSGRDRRRLGLEVMVDAYLASRAGAFIGNGCSNPSVMVAYLKEWPAARLKLLGPHLYHQPNPVLHRW